MIWFLFCEMFCKFLLEFHWRSFQRYIMGLKDRRNKEGEISCRWQFFLLSHPHIPHTPLMSKTKSCYKWHMWSSRSLAQKSSNIQESEVCVSSDTYTETRFSHYTIMPNHSTDPLYSPVNTSLSVTLLSDVISLFLNVINKHYKYCF